MENRGIFTKILAIEGTTLAWLPILAPILLSTLFLAREGEFRFDYLMPAELFPAVFIGGGSLLWAAVRSHAHRRLVGWSLGAALVLMLALLVVPEVTGLADGTTAAGGWQWALVLGILALYSAAIVAVGVGGTLILRDLFKSRHQPSTR